MPVLPVGWDDKKKTGRPALPRRFPMAIDVPKISNEIIRAEQFKVYTVVIAADGSGDYEDIQSGIDSLPSTGGTVYIKEGTYVLASSIKPVANTRLLGAGLSSILQAGDGIDDGVILVDSVDNVAIEGLQVDGNKSAQSETSDNAVNITGSRVRVDNCWIYDGAYSGIGINSGSDYVAVNYCILESNGRGSEGQGVIATDADELIVTNNVAINNGGNGFQLEPTCSDATICNNISRGNSTGFILHTASGSIIDGNVATSCDNSGIEINGCSDCVISNNIAMNNSQASAGAKDGIILLNPSTYNSVMGNSCSDTQSTHTQRYGIIESSACDFNSYIGNIARGNVTAPYRFIGENNEVVGNI